MKKNGLTQIELIIVVAAIAAVGVAMMGTFAKLSKLSVQSKIKHQLSVELGSRLTAMGTLEYASLHPTAAENFSYNYQSCTCDIGQNYVDNYDRPGVSPSYYAPEQVNILGTLYEFRYCVSYTAPSGGNLANVCPQDAIPDPGIKTVSVMAVIPNGPSKPATYVTGTKNIFNRTGAASQEVVAKGTFIVPVCRAKQADPTQCDAVNVADIVGAEVSFDKAGFHFTGTVPAPGPNPPTLSLDVYPQDNFSMYVIKPGFFPVKISRLNIAAGQTRTMPTVILRKMTEYASYGAGETFLVDRLRIVGIVCETCQKNGCGTAGCFDDHSEGVWIYNPTQQDMTIDVTTAFKFYDNAHAGGRNLVLTPPTPTTFVIHKGGYLFGFGRDSAANPGSSLPPWATWKPDFEWDVSVLDMIPCNNNNPNPGHGGIVLTSPIPGNPTDNVGWKDTSGNSPPAAIFPHPMGGGAGSLPQPDVLQPRKCGPGGVLSQTTS